MKPALRILIPIALFFVLDHAVFHLLEKGIRAYYELDKPAEILCIGHSHTVLGIDGPLLEKETGLAVAKYAIAGANVTDRYYMIRHYLSLYPDVKAVIYDVDPRLFDAEGLSSASYSLFLPFIENSEMKDYLRQEAGIETYMTSRFIKTARFRDQTLNISLRGLLDKKETVKHSTVDISRYAHYLENERDRRIRTNQDSVRLFEETINYVTARGIQMVLVHIPVIDLLNDIDPESQAKVIQIFTSQGKKEHVTFLNYSEEYDHRHELFFDLRHLNEKGKKMITGRLITDLKAIHD